MASHERRAIVRVGEPDIGFQAGFGFYLGIVVTGIIALAGLLAGTSTATLLGVLPSTVTAVAIVGHIYTKRAHGLPERIGRNRWRRLACYAPAAAFGAMLVAPRFAPIEATGRLVVVTVALVALTGVSGFGVERMAKNRYIDAITVDEPAASWTWHRSDFRADERVWNVMLVLMIGAVGLVTAWTSGGIAGLFWVLYAAIVVASQWFDWGDDWNSFEPEDRWNPPELHAHEAGVVVDKSVGKTFVPWDAIAAVRLTDDELILERRRTRWFDIRCDRSGIEDPEDVFAELERLAHDERRTI
ncbi:PH domain-containing protein [Natrinema salaciae]|uniref:PH domain-containing protein n=1 Tax=Natrinema salaciae TaxID=1186196 RepID=A0A1H9K2X9_9EURY|nr:PH domain-containing protein [Natrinema salaciae]SEQ93601.1 PH domain-containing protein [Natrinema salaciae]